MLKSPVRRVAIAGIVVVLSLALGIVTYIIVTASTVHIVVDQIAPIPATIPPTPTSTPEPTLIPTPIPPQITTDEQAIGVAKTVLRAYLSDKHPRVPNFLPNTPQTRIFKASVGCEFFTPSPSAYCDPGVSKFATTTSVTRQTGMAWVVTFEIGYLDWDTTTTLQGLRPISRWVIEIQPSGDAQMADVKHYYDADSSAIYPVFELDQN